ncbi:MAG: Hsp20/alpha crystallin family protein [Desulfocapsaceae bacterium]|jgi:HSP20 family protein|nr:Hsp20/alpha crystallin family protein [Desulfocapsaceae bacterium]
MFVRIGDLDRMFGTMGLFRDRLGTVFEDFDRSFGSAYDWTATGTFPRTNLYDKGDHFELTAELPGIAKADVHVKIQGNYLEISGTKKVHVPEGYSVHRTERGDSTFTRSLTLPADVDSAKVSASIKDGLLVLTMPKSEAAKPRQISIG